MRSGFYARKLANRPRRRYKKKTLTKKVSQLSKKVGNKERKVLDTQLTSIALTSALTTTNLTNVVQGITDVLRLGNKITIVGVELSYQVESAISNSVRMMLVQNKQTNGLVLDGSELFEDQSAGDIIISPYNKDFLRKFRVLYDKTHTFSITGNAFVIHKKHIKCNIPIRYDANVGDITDLQSNSLSWVSSVDSADASAVSSMFIRLWFTDS